MITGFIDRIKAKLRDPANQPGITVAFIGDSVTQGCFELVETSAEGFDTSYHPQWAYATRFKQLLNTVFPKIFVNLINAGLSGEGAQGGRQRLEREVLSHHPDLVVISYGLNDCGRREAGLEGYLQNICDMVRRCRETGAEVIFMSANGMCTHPDVRMKQQRQIDIANSCAATQKEGWCRRYFEEAGRVAVEEGGYFADCNGRWEALAAAGANMTAHLSNHINHPTKEMHWLFANTLFETVFF